MNKHIEEKAKALNQWILDQEVVKEYLKYEKLIENNQELKQLEEELKQLQQEIVIEKHSHSHCDSLIQEYEQKKKVFDENPLLYNYLSLKQEVNDLLCRIQDDINEQLKKKVD